MVVLLMHYGADASITDGEGKLFISTWWTIDVIIYLYLIDANTSIYTKLFSIGY